ncbi:pantetheine-phosphate adenylyltransferase [Nafulsella turpanensis]|uniref:pantetheine-phosphate adenylyltransferase n=1 Tax=Nafulsella turpanensis TaxID=1265690 RepID=UPI0003482F11|nr:pantetheine-phosphate adenylyltransferase [Nafulsella turpanensis]
MDNNKRVALFPGSFDPFTKGHEDIVLRGLKLFDQIIIAIGYNSQKQNRYIEIDRMIGLIEKSFANEERVSVITYNELTAGLAHKTGARFLLRGLRNTTDFEFENSVSQMNRYLFKELETVFLITSPTYAAISSSIIREVHKYGADVNEFLPYEL